MLTRKEIQEAYAFNNSGGVGGGACFGVTDPSRLRPMPSELPVVLPAETKGVTRRIVMVDDGQGNMVPDDQLPEPK